MALVQDPTQVIAVPETKTATPSGGIVNPPPPVSVYDPGDQEGLLVDDTPMRQEYPNFQPPSSRYWTIVLDGYQYQFNITDYPYVDKAIREAVYLMNYDPDFRSWFSENLGRYKKNTSDGIYHIDIGYAKLDFEKLLVQHPDWEPDSRHMIREGEIENYSLTRDEAISYFSQTVGIELKELREKQAAQAMAAAKQRDEQIAKLEAIRKEQELMRDPLGTLAEYLKGGLQANAPAGRSWEDFFNRIVPKLQATIPAFGTLASIVPEAYGGGGGDSMAAFQFYIWNQQMRNLGEALGIGTKSGKAVNLRPIYNIKNYYPRYQKVTKPRVKRKG